MDIAGYLFVGMAIIFVVYGLIDGLVHSILTAVALVGSMAAGVLLTPTIANLEFVKKLIEDTPVIIGGQEICFLRMVIVFFALFVLSLLSCLIVRGLLKGILKRVKILKLIDRLLGASLNATIAWALFGVLFALQIPAQVGLLPSKNNLQLRVFNLDWQTLWTEHLHQLATAQFCKWCTRCSIPLATLS